MIQKKSSGVNIGYSSILRTPITTLRPTNAPTVTAGVVYRDHALGLVLHSIRREGIHNNSRAIQFDTSVLTQAEQLGVVVVEVAQGGRTYSATIETLRSRGRYVTTRFGPQVALALRWWSTEGVTPMAEPDTPIQPDNTQLALFEVNA